MSPTKQAGSDDELDDATKTFIAAYELAEKEWQADLDDADKAAIDDAVDESTHIPESVVAEIHMNERRAYKEPSEEPQPWAAVQMAIAADRSRSPPTRRGGFQSHPPIPKPLPQTPAPRIAYTPRTEPPTTMQWTLSPLGELPFLLPATRRADAAADPVRRHRVGRRPPRPQGRRAKAKGKAHPHR